MVTGGIPENSIGFSRYSSTPSYGWSGDKPSSYEISNEIRISISKEENLLIIADMVDSFNEVRFIKTEFKYLKGQETKSKALEKSIQDIISKKQLYEKLLGVTLTPVRIIEQAVNEEAPVVLQASKKGFTSGSSSIPSISFSDINFEFEEDSSGFGKIRCKVQTQVEFIINQK